MFMQYLFHLLIWFPKYVNAQINDYTQTDNIHSTQKHTQTDKTNMQTHMQYVPIVFSTEDCTCCTRDWNSKHYIEPPGDVHEKEKELQELEEDVIDDDRRNFSVEYIKSSERVKKCERLFMFPKNSAC